MYNELDDKDKLSFIDALLNKQFLNVDPTNLTGMAKFAYISQTNSIDGQVKGYNDKMKSLGKAPLGAIDPPCQGGAQGGVNTPTEQGKEKGEVKEKGEEEENPAPSDSIFSIGVLKEKYLSNRKVIKAVLDNKANGFKDEEHLKKRLDIFCNELLERSDTSKTMVDFSSHFRSWQKKKKFGNGIEKVGNKMTGII